VSFSENPASGTDEFIKGLWRENPVFVQVLGMCPVLAVTNTARNALAMGLATMFVLVMSNMAISSVRRWIPKQVRIATFILIIASFVTIVDYVIQAISLDLHKALGAFISLIVVNCVILGRAEAFASRQPVPAALADGIAHGLGFAAVLIVLGGLRELLGYGGLLTDIDTLISPAAQELATVTSHQQTGLLLAILPPGAFIGLAILIALRHALARRMAATGRIEDSATDS
jgi:electron transport complex protein RnfE